MARKPLPADLYLLSKVGKLYYEQGLTQHEIALKLHLSRPKVSRLTQQAIDEGVVQITVHAPQGTFSNLEYQLEKRYNLREATVVEALEPASQESVSRELGIAAARYFQRTVQDGDIIGISWGRTLSAMVNALQPMHVENVHIVQMIGGLGYPEAEVHATSLCRRLTQLLDSKLTLLPAPGIVDTVAVKQAIFTDSHMLSVLELFARINVAYVGIGAPTPDSVVLRGGKIMSQEDIRQLTAMGAVGDIALRFFDRDGRAVLSELDERVIGITLEQLKQIDHVVGVTGGPQKNEVVSGALRGGLVDVLITDLDTARYLLDLSNQSTN
jgi:DNA-binding transcriptional regulator LsrR (DeoR family)